VENTMITLSDATDFLPLYPRAKKNRAKKQKMKMFTTRAIRKEKSTWNSVVCERITKKFSFLAVLMLIMMLGSHATR
jgi:hypothetical protein